MQKKLYSLSLNKETITLPKKALTKILSGQASEDEIKVLLAASVLGGQDLTTEDIAKKAEMDVSETQTALSFWRGASVICTHSKRKSDGATEKPSANDSSIAPVTAQTDTEASKTAQADEPEQMHLPTAQVGSIEPATEQSSPAATENDKKLLTRDMPKYTALEISGMIEKDGGRLREMVDACQQLIGHIFTPSETSIMVGLSDWLGVEPEYVTTLTAYLADKKPKLYVRYIEKTAVELVNDGISDLSALDLYIKSMELFDGVSGKLRALTGIGGQEYTDKQNGMIQKWVNKFGYDIDIIKEAYDQCCDNTGKFNFKYADKILENWYKLGVRTLADAQKLLSDYQSAKKTQSTQKGSFDTDEFFDLALKRTYKNMTNGKK